MMIEELAKNVNEFYDELKRCPNDRYLSWEHCYEVFDDGRRQKFPDNEKLCLHLAFYLASWGMYRGSSFLLQRDYLIHVKAIKLLLDKRYAPLWGIEAKDLCKTENADLVWDLYERLAAFYKKIREDVCRNTIKTESPKADISRTLITKILMGTMGCCPAFDRYFVRGLKEFKMCQTFSKDTLVEIAKFYVVNAKAFAKAKRKTKRGGLKYPQMKIVDMAFWKCGYHLANEDVQENLLE